ncbi:retropepsin-like domain-containing protein [Parasegetibacter sp. NRK P23]|uniref:retropepsin-like domain-containing protein n=1 Tax=Parasegetibacter sp. NRK P23 TaxID=2942999 RepID=UPI002044AEC9|nr:retropepsin-like domain-containing protein [Parasegetibacter sp. NRK P23]MCM5528654.1 retropepsin-like domain-containing protein [Parasegetibacter sp. NRK P23]
MRKTLLILVVLLSGQRLAAQDTLLFPGTLWYDFYWDGDEQYPRDAMMLRSRIDTIDFNFRWQFDTGSPRTFFYGKLWNSFVAAYPYLGKRFFITDSTRLDGFTQVANPLVRISGKLLPKNRLGVMENYGNAVEPAVILESRGASATIGTIGIDLFRDGVLVINFKDNKIGFTSVLKEAFYAKKERNVVDFMLYQNRIILPVTVGGKKLRFFYDSGASLFPLKSTASFLGELPAVNYTDTLRNITTWGKSHDVPGGVFKEKVFIGKMEIKQPKLYIHPDPDKFHTNIFREAGTLGLIGNEFFQEKVLVLDFTRMKCAILDQLK